MSEKTHNKSELWQTRIDAYHSSGLSGKEWSAANQIPYSTLCYWMNKLKQEQSKEVVFAPLPEKNLFSLSAGSPITIRFASASIEISGHCHPDLLENLISILSHYA